jgi:hypothetical protein
MLDSKNLVLGTGDIQLKTATEVKNKHCNIQFPLYEDKLSPSPSDLNKVKTLCGLFGYKDFHTISQRYTEKLDVLYGFQL